MAATEDAASCGEGYGCRYGKGFKYFVVASSSGLPVFSNHPHENIYCELSGPFNFSSANNLDQFPLAMRAGDTRFVFSKYKECIFFVVTDGAESDAYLRRQLILLRDYMVMRLEAHVFRRLEDDRVRDLNKYRRPLAPFIRTMSHIASTSQGFLVEGIELLGIAEEKRAQLARQVLRAIPGASEYHTVLLFVGPKLICSHTSARTPDLDPVDLVLIVLHFTALFRPPVPPQSAASTPSGFGSSSSSFPASPSATPEPPSRPPQARAETPSPISDVASEVPAPSTTLDEERQSVPVPIPRPAGVGSTAPVAARSGLRNSRTADDVGRVGGTAEGGTPGHARSVSVGSADLSSRPSSDSLSLCTTPVGSAPHTPKPAPSPPSTPHAGGRSSVEDVELGEPAQQEEFEAEMVDEPGSDTWGDSDLASLNADEDDEEEQVQAQVQEGGDDGVAAVSVMEAGVEAERRHRDVEVCDAGGVASGIASGLAALHLDGATGAESGGQGSERVATAHQGNISLGSPRADEDIPSVADASSLAAGANSEASASPQPPKKRTQKAWFGAVPLRLGKGYRPCWLYCAEIVPTITLVLIRPRDEPHRGSAREEAVQARMEAARAGVWYSLKDFTDYFVTMENSQLTVWTYVEHFPGLVHFVYVDGASSEVLAPALMDLRPDDDESASLRSGGSPTAAVEDEVDTAEARRAGGPVGGTDDGGRVGSVEAVRRAVWNAVFLAHDALGQGLASAAARIGPLTPSFQLWVEDAEGRELPMAGRRVRDLLPKFALYPTKYRARLRDCFPASRSPAVYELYAVYLDVVPTAAIAAMNRELVRLLRLHRK